MADFSNFERGDNVLELADGLLPEMAEVFEVDLGQGTEEDLGRLVGAIGTSKVLQENIPLVQEKLGTDQSGLEIAASWLGRSGVQEALNRSLWIPELHTPDSASIVITGAVANWQDRTAQLVSDQPNEHVYIAAGNRVMETPTEKVNANVETFFESEGRYPTESEYALLFVAPVITASDKAVSLRSYDTANGEEIADRFLWEGSHIFVEGRRIAFARVANAGIQLAAQFVRAARSLNFDTNSSDPQAFVLTDTFPIAQTEDETKKAKAFQNPYTGIRQIAVTAKELVSLTA